MKLYVFIIAFFLVGGLTVYSLTNFTHPSSTDPSTHIEELKKIPHVKAFYQMYDDVKDPYILDDDTSGYRIVFESSDSSHQATLELYYFAWQLFPIQYRCFDIEEKTLVFSSYNLEEMIEMNCFDNF